MLTISIRHILILTLLLVLSVQTYRWLFPPIVSAPKQVSETRKIALPAPPTIEKPQRAQPTLPYNIDRYDDPVMRSAYFCDLALTQRERCEKIPRDPQSIEFCLKATGYYSNSRHCGYQP